MLGNNIPAVEAGTEDTRRGIDDIIPAGSVVEVTRPDGSIAKIHHPVGTVNAQVRPWYHFQPKGAGKKATGMSGIQRHTRSIISPEHDPTTF